MSARRWSVDTLRKRHARIALDANVLIYLLEAVEGRGQRAAAVLDATGPGGLRASIATIGQVEALVGPARSGDPAAFERAAHEVRDLGLDLISLTPEIAEDAAWLRGQAGLPLADSIHVASATAAGATVFVTNDQRIRPRPGLAVYYLDDLDPDEPVA